MSTYVRELNARQLDELIDEVRGAERVYKKSTEQAGVAGVLFVWLGILGGAALAPFVTAAGLITAAAGFYESNKREVINDFIDDLEDYKDTLQDNPGIDLIRIEIRVSTKQIEDEKFKYPSSAKVIGFRSNGQWMEIE